MEKDLKIMKKPIRIKEQPDRDFWIIEASSSEEAEAILKERIKAYYDLTEEEYLKNNFTPKQELKISK